MNSWQGSPNGILYSIAGVASNNIKRGYLLKQIPDNVGFYLLMIYLEIITVYT